MEDLKWGWAITGILFDIFSTMEIYEGFREYHRYFTNIS